MALIIVNQGESIESALRKFAPANHEGIIQDLKNHAYVMPPTQKAKLKSKSKQARMRRRNMRRWSANLKRGPIETTRMSGDS